jgi:GNAT superfamily N-acetyltransferase
MQGGCGPQNFETFVSHYRQPCRTRKCRDLKIFFPLIAGNLSRRHRVVETRIAFKVMFQIRTSQPSDAPEIATVFAHSCRKAYNPFFPPSLISRYTPAKQLDRWTNQLNELSSNRRLFVAVSSESPQTLGFIQVGPSEEDGVGEIQYLFVSPNCMRTGVGSALLHYGEQWLIAQGYKSGLLWVFTENGSGVAFYLNQGWKDSGVVQDEPTLVKTGFKIKECKLRKSFSS